MACHYHRQALGIDGRHTVEKRLMEMAHAVDRIILCLRIVGVIDIRHGCYIPDGIAIGTWNLHYMPAVVCTILVACNASDNLYIECIPQIAVQLKTRTAVVVAGSDNNLHPRPGIVQFEHHSVVEPLRCKCRGDIVVYVAADNKHIGLLFHDNIFQPGKEPQMLICAVHPMELLPQVPVACMDCFHILLNFQKEIRPVHESQYKEQYKEIGKREPHTIVVAHKLLQSMSERVCHTTEVHHLAQKICSN